MTTNCKTQAKKTSERNDKVESARPGRLLLRVGLHRANLAGQMCGRLTRLVRKPTLTINPDRP
jgi:hypothetical protein